MCGPNSNGSGPPGAGQASHGHRPLRDSIDFLLHGRGQESTVDRQNYERSPAMCGDSDAPARRASHEIDRDIFNARRRRPGPTKGGPAMCGGGHDKPSGGKRGKPETWPRDYRPSMFTRLRGSLAMCGGKDSGTPGGKTDRLRTPYGHRYPEGPRGPIHRGGVGGVTQGNEKRYGRRWLGFAPALALTVLACGGGSSPEQDLDDPNYDAFRISRRARGRRDGPWNRFAALAGAALVVLGIRRVRSA